MRFFFMLAVNILNAIISSAAFTFFNAQILNYGIYILKT